MHLRDQLPRGEDVDHQLFEEVRPPGESLRVESSYVVDVSRLLRSELSGRRRILADICAARRQREDPRLRRRCVGHRRSRNYLRRSSGPPCTSACRPSRASESSRPGRASTSSARSTRTPSSAGTRTPLIWSSRRASRSAGCSTRRASGAPWHAHRPSTLRSARQAPSTTSNARVPPMPLRVYGRVLRDAHDKSTCSSRRVTVHSPPPYFLLAFYSRRAGFLT